MSICSVLSGSVTEMALANILKLNRSAVRLCASFISPNTARLKFPLDEFGEI